MEYLAIIQARSGSTRLPGKVLKNLEGRSELEWVYSRVSKSKHVDKVVVATTTKDEDDSVVELCGQFGAECKRGSCDDVLDRYYSVAKEYSPSYVIRLTADCPCFDPQLLDQAIEELDTQSDYLGMLSETFPDGLDLEIMKFSALEEAWKKANLASEREHLTQYIVKNPSLFRLQDFVCPEGNLGFERWTVDEPEDFELVSRIFKHFISNDNEDFYYLDIHNYLNENPQLRNINAMYSRNEGLKKSLLADHVVHNGEEHAN